LALNKAAQAGLTRAQALEEKTPSVLSLDKVKEKYAKDGVLSAAGEVLSQAPGFIMEQLPQLGTAFAGARLGALAGIPSWSGYGPVVWRYCWRALPYGIAGVWCGCRTAGC
jgi:hypothetical protein